MKMSAAKIQRVKTRREGETERKRVTRRAAEESGKSGRRRATKGERVRGGGLGRVPYRGSMSWKLSPRVTFLVLYSISVRYGNNPKQFFLAR
mgnify:CR=1 FL=1